MWLSSVLLVVAFVIVAIRWFHKWRSNFARHIPWVRPYWPLLGNGSLFIGKDDVQRFCNMQKMFDGKEKLFRFYLGPKTVFGTNDPSTAQQILSDPDCMDKPYVYDYFLADCGVFAAKTTIWRSQRKALNPTSNVKVLQEYIPTFCRINKAMVERLKLIPDGKTINFMDYASRLAVELICASTLDFDINQFDDPDGFAHNMERVFYVASRRMLNVHLQLDTIYQWTKDYREERALRNKMECYAMKIYESAEKRFSPCDEDDESDASEKPRILVHQLFNNKRRKFEKLEILHNIYTIIAAGTDTTANAVSFTCLQLAMHPEHQERLHKEIIEMFPDSDPLITMERLASLPYLDMVLKECLRLYPAAWIVMRENSADVIIDDFVFPKGCKFAVNIFSMHRRVDVWGPDANLFNPERFSEDRAEKRHRYAFLPFSGGRRDCLGARYAMLSMRIMMVYLVKNFRFITSMREENIRFRFDALLRIQGGHQLQLIRR
ncbi:cytochrome P450 4c21-like [Armigeres subalbatus]|uniref:cytochrome P450 4c21-like n=1 Tax=Armigeres subalbatus TaxID=124917 RepID=UPI002ED351E1